MRTMILGQIDNDAFLLFLGNPDGAVFIDHVVHHPAPSIAVQSLRAGQFQAVAHTAVRFEQLLRRGLDHGLDGWSSCSVARAFPISALIAAVTPARNPAGIPERVGRLPGNGRQNRGTQMIIGFERPFQVDKVRREKFLITIQGPLNRGRRLVKNTGHPRPPV